MAGNRPNMKFKAVKKDKSEAPFELLAVWDGPRGMTAKLPPGTKIKLADGRVYDAEEIWVNGYVNQADAQPGGPRPIEEKVESTFNARPYQPGTKMDIPF